MRPPQSRYAHRILAVGTILALSAVHATARAQATQATATEAIHLQLYGVGSYVRPEYGGQRTAGGFAAGGAIGFTQRFVPRLEPFLDFRYTYATNNLISQGVYAGGLRVAYNTARFHPYGDFMVGNGTIHFKQVPANSTYTQDNSTVLMYGGGLDFDVTRTIALRADVQRQNWQIDQRAAPFYPVQASLGIRYQFHFRNRYGME